MVGLSFALAVPISWLVMNNWLQGFAYRINISLWMFATAGVIDGIDCLGDNEFSKCTCGLGEPNGEFAQRIKLALIMDINNFKKTKTIGITAHSYEGAALCFLSACREGGVLLYKIAGKIRC